MLLHWRRGYHGLFLPAPMRSYGGYCHINTRNHQYIPCHQTMAKILWTYFVLCRKCLTLNNVMHRSKRNKTQPTSDFTIYSMSLYRSVTIYLDCCLDQYGAAKGHNTSFNVACCNILQQFSVICTLISPPKRPNLVFSNPNILYTSGGHQETRPCIWVKKFEHMPLLRRYAQSFHYVPIYRT